MCVLLKKKLQTPRKKVYIVTVVIVSDYKAKYSFAVFQVIPVISSVLHGTFGLHAVDRGDLKNTLEERARPKCSYSVLMTRRSGSLPM